MKKLLVVIDVQNDFVDGSLGTREAVGIVDNVVQKVRQSLNDGVEVVFTRDAHTENYLNTQEGRNLPIKHCIVGTHGYEIVKPLLPYVTKVFDKSTFGNVEMASFVKENGFDCVEIVGLCTDICVVTNALLIKAFCPEVLIEVDSSCCAGVTVASHQSALDTMRACQIKVK